MNNSREPTRSEEFTSDPTFASDAAARAPGSSVSSAASALGAAIKDERENLADGAASSGPAHRSGKLLAALVFGGLAYGAAAVGRPISKRRVWYKTLRKADANPPSWVFGPVWTGLYAAIAYSGYRTWKQPASPERKRALRLWALQMALNASWTPLFFGLHRPKASASVSAALLPTIGGYMAAARKVDKVAAWSMLPYLGWSAFATYLNAEIIRKNSWRL